MFFHLGLFSGIGFDLISHKHQSYHCFLFYHDKPTKSGLAPDWFHTKHGRPEEAISFSATALQLRKPVQSPSTKEFINAFGHWLTNKKGDGGKPIHHGNPSGGMALEGYP